MKTWKRFLAMVMSLIMAFSLIQLPALAFAQNDFDVTSVSVEKSDSEQEISISFYSKNGIEGFVALEGYFDTADSTGKLSLKSLTSNKLDFTGMNEALVSNGKVMWADDVYLEGVTFSANEAIVTATYTLAAGAPAGNYTLSFKNVIGQEAQNWDQFENGNYSATITVTEPTTPAEAPDYELYYTLDSTADTDSPADGYYEYGVNDTITATFYMKAKTETTLQAFDLYVQNSGNLTYGGLTSTYGKLITDGTNASTDTLQHIQAVGYDAQTKPIGLSLPAGVGVEIAKITYTFGENAYYGEQLPITITAATNVAVAGETASINPSGAEGNVLTIGTDPKGAEINTTYTVTFHTDGGSDVPTQTIGHNLYATTPDPAPTKTGYTLAGWYTDERGTNQVDFSSTKIDADSTFYAVWNVNYYTVKWMSQDGNTVLGISSVAYNKRPTYPDGFTEPTKTNTDEFTYAFAGWATKTNQTTGTQVGELPFVTDTTEPIKYYAAFSATTNSYTVTWANIDGNGASRTDENVLYGTTPSYGTTNPSKAEDNTYTYTWTGWQNGTNTYGTVDTLPAVTGDVTYTATFDSTYKNYTIEYKAGDHAASDYVAPAAKTDAHYGVAYNLPEAATPADGYTFAGWSPDGTTLYGGGASYTPTGTATMTAIYTEKKYTVAYNANTGSGSAPQSHTDLPFTTEFTAAANTFTAPAGYKFNGWNTAADGNGITVNAGSSYKLSTMGLDSAALAGTTITLYAQWTLDSDWTITYKGDEGATYTTANPTSYNAETAAFTLNNPEKAGYTFKGWSGTGLTGDMNTVVTVTPGTAPWTQDLEFTANWTANNVKYTVEHYWQNVENDNYVLHETEGADGSLTAPTGSTVTAATKTYEGFTYDGSVTGTVASAEVLADGTTTLKLYYTRNSYKVTFTVTGDQPTDAPTAPTEQSYKFGATVPVPAALSLQGYVFNGWTAAGVTLAADATSFSMPANNVSFTGYWTAGISNYTVKHYKENLDGTYPNEPNDTDTLSGTTGAATAAEAKTYEGFTAGTITQTTIKPDGSTFVEIRYTRNKHNVTYSVTNADTMKSTPSELPTSVEYKFGAEITVADAATAAGYTFKGWQVPTDINVTDGKFIMPDKEVNITGTFAANKYKITFNTDGGMAIAEKTYTIEDTVTLPTATGKTNYDFVNWKLTAVDGDHNWGTVDEATYETGDQSGRYGNVTLTAQWTAALTYALQDYKYAPTGYKLLIIDAEGAGDGNVFTYNNDTMYYTTDTNYMIKTGSAEDGSDIMSTAVFYTLIPTSSTDTLTAEEYSKIAAASGTRQIITYDGDVNGDNTVNIADANTVFQMVVNGGGYYGNTLTIAQRLAADMVKTTSEGDMRGTIEDVHAIVNIINGVSA